MEVEGAGGREPFFVEGVGGIPLSVLARVVLVPRSFPGEAGIV